MSADITGLTLEAAAAAIKQRKLSSVEATKACLEAISAAQPKLNCFISIEAEQALAQAARADQEIGQGRYRGALHGVPMAHKDMYYRAGKISTCGSKIYAQHPAQTTATVNEKLDAAGAIWLGGLNMSEFAAGPTGHNTHYGHCRNPWNPAHITGGSSSGSGCSVGARLVYGSMGSDTGGSVRLPAGMCGVAGLKPTYGLISRYGMMPRCWSLDVAGPLARTVRDCATITQVVAGHDARDSSSANLPVPDYLAGLTGELKGLRIGIPVNAEFADTAPEVQRCLDESIKAFQSLGAQIERVELPDPRLLYHLTNLINKAEAATIHGRWVKSRRGEYTLSAVNRFEAGYLIPVTHYLDARRLQGRILGEFVDRVFRSANVLHLPMLGIPVPTIAETEIRETSDVPALMEKITRHTRWLNYLGLPGLSVPCGFSGNGLPVAFQLLGRPFSEKTLFRAGDAYQRVTDWHERRPT